MNAVSRLYLISRVIALCLFAFTLPATADSPDENTVRISFRTVKQFLVVVPVSINGAGPFNFLLDTGATNSDIDRGLADQLSLPDVGEKEVTGLQGTVRLSIVHAQSISVAGRTVRDLNLNVLSKANGLPSKVSGILGEDFLGNFDLLIDNEHHVIQLQQGPGTMSDMFEGERLPVQLAYHGWTICQPHTRRHWLLQRPRWEADVAPFGLRCELPVSLWRGAKPRGRRDTARLFRCNDLRSLETVPLYTKGASATALREQEGLKPDSGRSAADDRGIRRRIDADIRIPLDLHQSLAKIRHSRSVVEMLQTVRAGPDRANVRMDW